MATTERRVVMPGCSARDDSLHWRGRRLVFRDMSGPFAAQQYLQFLLAPDGGAAAVEELTAVPEGCDPGVWQYEHIRCVLCLSFCHSVILSLFSVVLSPPFLIHLLLLCITLLGVLHLAANLWCTSTN